MAVHAHIFNDSTVRIWGLTSRQRLSRMLNSAGEIESWFSEIDPAKHKQPLAVQLFSQRPVDLF